jgi:hypothetical protein
MTRVSEQHAQELTDDAISFQALAPWMGKQVLLGVVGTISFWLASSWSNGDQHDPSAWLVAPGNGLCDRADRFCSLARRSWQSANFDDQAGATAVT